MKVLFVFSSRRRYTRWPRDWSSDVCSSDLMGYLQAAGPELYEQILFAVGSRDFQVQNQEHNPIFRLVREADMHSTSKDRSEERRVGKETRGRSSRSNEKKKLKTHTRV